MMVNVDLMEVLHYNTWLAIFGWLSSGWQVKLKLI
jgi:hypothetical protein